MIDAAGPDVSAPVHMVIMPSMTSQKFVPTSAPARVVGVHDPVVSDFPSVLHVWPEYRKLPRPVTAPRGLPDSGHPML